MTIRFNFLRLNPCWLLASALLFPLQFCRAQVDVPPTITFNLGASDRPETQLWDLNGSYQVNLTVVQRNGFETPIQFSFILLQDAKGHLSSPTNDSPESLVIGDNGLFAVKVNASGKVTGSGGAARVHFTVHARGSGTLSGVPVNSINASMTVDAETDPTTGDLVGSKMSKFSASLSDFPDVRGSGDLDTPTPNGANASWTLTMNLVALKKLTGTGSITTPNRPLGINLTGTMKNGNIKLKAKGADNVPNTLNGNGIKATIQLDPTFETGTFNGKVLGQQLLFSLP